MDEDMRLDRRQLIISGGSALTVGLAGCSGDGGSSDSGSGSGSGSQDTQEPADSETDGEASYQPLEIQHWWAGADGGPAIKALLEGFQKAYPDIEIKENPVSGGGGQNLRAVVKRRVLNDNPPSTWQQWPGAALNPYLEADKLEPIGESVWTHNDMKEGFSEEIQELSKANGNYYYVPVEFHRLNNLFYNANVIEAAGVDVSSIGKPSDLVDAMVTVEENTDAVGMAQQTKSPWSTLQLWENVLLGEHGIETYRAFLDGEVGANEAAIKDALEIVTQYQQHFNEDAGSLAFTEANNIMINGNAAFFHQGDWVAGAYLRKDGFKYQDDWDHVPYPGTDGFYHVVTTGFCFPRNNPSPNSTEAFLRYIGTKEAQLRFNVNKGCISARTDLPLDHDEWDFSPFQESQYDDYKNNEGTVGSVAHNQTVDPNVASNLKEAMATFTSSWDVDRTYGEIEAAFE